MLLPSNRRNERSQDENLDRFHRNEEVNAVKVELIKATPQDIEESNENVISSKSSNHQKSQSSKQNPREAILLSPILQRICERKILGQSRVRPARTY